MIYSSTSSLLATPLSWRMAVAALIFSCRFGTVVAQVPLPVSPFYNSTDVKLYTREMIPDYANATDLWRRGAVEMRNFACLTNSNKGHHSVNSVRNVWNRTLFHDKSVTNHLKGTTYWVNDWLHVGHVHYDIVLIQLLQTTKVDRIVHQRPACAGTLCVGRGTVDGFYKGYYAALFEAFNQSIPVFIRWGGRDRFVKPLYFSARTNSYYKHTDKAMEAMEGIKLDHIMCFERVFFRAKLNYGSVPTVSASAVQAFKSAAYAMLRLNPPLTTHFIEGAPFRILLSYRGPKATRRLENLEELADALRKSFPAPKYIFRLFNNSDSNMTFSEQIQAVAESHVVITNHGAFEGNMIYMRNASLLVELFGKYGNNEVHTFHRLAVMFGLYYARLNSEGLKNHQGKSYSMSKPEIEDVVRTLKTYFKRKAYSRNMRGASGLFSSMGVMHDSSIVLISAKHPAVFFVFLFLFISLPLCYLMVVFRVQIV